MTIIYNKKDKKELRRDLRKQSTKPEQILWNSIRAGRLGIKFRRQHSIGRYILDFYCVDKKLCIEVDGDTHFTDDAREYDELRTKYLECLGIQVIRFTNTDVMNNIDGILYKIKELCSD